MNAGDIVVFTDQAVACGALGKDFDYRGKWVVETMPSSETVQIRRIAGPITQFPRCTVARVWLVLLED